MCIYNTIYVYQRLEWKYNIRQTCKTILFIFNIAKFCKKTTCFYPILFKNITLFSIILEINIRFKQFKVIFKIIFSNIVFAIINKAQSYGFKKNDIRSLNNVLN